MNRIALPKLLSNTLFNIVLQSPNYYNISLPHKLLYYLLIIEPIELFFSIYSYSNSIVFSEKETK